MEQIREQFGSIDGNIVDLYKLINNRGTSISILSYGAAWHEWWFGGQNILLTGESIEDYIGYSLNKIIGRTSGRTEHGQFYIHNKKINIPINASPNAIHGGRFGLSNQLFDLEFLNQDGIKATYMAREAVDGYPGNLLVEVIYRLKNNNTVTIEISGTQSLRDGVFNPTSHTFFNLNDNSSSELSNHDLLVSSDMIAVNNQNGSYSEIKKLSEKDVKNFSEGKDIQTVLNNIDDNGLDDVYVFDRQTDFRASIKNKQSGLTLSLYGDTNALVVYTANTFNRYQKFTRGEGKPFMGIALESQMIPNSENKKIDDVVIRDGETVRRKIIYKLTC
ncbi:aldose epimerase family protein [Leuconostoc pseudomesenteroides]|uniref:aldose epimerase family protein n=1 Tax=Leuconostoc pseudomesenteroides TaxID=33968 RepID=UPI00166AB167|nr:hypothetical protein [Leuconostoc pseudomesenteroides]